MKNKENIGGGGGSRTRVRKPSAFGSTCLVVSIVLTVLPPDRQGIPHGDSGLGFSESAPDMRHRDLVRYDA